METKKATEGQEIKKELTIEIHKCCKLTVQELIRYFDTNIDAIAKSSGFDITGFERTYPIKIQLSEERKDYFSYSADVILKLK